MRKPSGRTFQFGDGWLVKSCTRRTPVVVLSSSREDKDVVTSYRLGANSYLVKPLNFEEFNQMSSVLAPYWTQLNQQPQN